MSRKRNMLNVRAQLEHIVWSIEAMLEDEGKHKNGIVLPPIYQDNLKMISFLARATLRKSITAGRKDLRIEVHAN